MVKMHSMLDDQVQVQDGHGNVKSVDGEAITRMIASFTDNPQTLTRATDLIVRQLSLYSTIKEFDLRCLIFKTLKQLGYQHTAKKYYQQYLAREVQ